MTYEVYVKGGRKIDAHSTPVTFMLMYVCRTWTCTLKADIVVGAINSDIANINTPSHRTTKWRLSRNRRDVQIAGAFEAMMSGRMVLREVIGIIISTPSPINHEFLGANAVTDPIKSHINSLGPFLFDRIISDPSSTGIISLDGCWGLWMA
jgi:hypothetical protein